MEIGVGFLGDEILPLADIGPPDHIGAVVGDEGRSILVVDQLLHLLDVETEVGDGIVRERDLCDLTLIGGDRLYIPDLERPEPDLCFVCHRCRCSGFSRSLAAEAAVCSVNAPLKAGRGPAPQPLLAIQFCQCQNECIMVRFEAGGGIKPGRSGEER